MQFNPSTAVPGPKHIVKRGKTLVLAEEGRQLLDNIDVSTPAGLRDRADGLHLRPERSRHGNAGRRRVRSEPAAVGNLAREGQKIRRAALPPQLDVFLHSYLNGSGLTNEPQGPLFSTISRGAGQLTRKSLLEAGSSRFDVRSNARQPAVLGEAFGSLSNVISRSR